MTNDLLLLLLRLISASLLLTLLGALFYMLWKDTYQSAARADNGRRQFGSLYVLREISGRIMETGESYPLLAITSLGRSPTNTIPIDDTFASSEHALLTLRAGQWWLEDRRSRNGTTLNDVPVLQPIVITDGDIIGIGTMRFRFSLE